MINAIVYVDHSEIRDGRRDELEAAIRELAEFVADNEPGIVAYNVYFNAQGTRMTVMHMHVDSESLEYHMRVAGPRFSRFADLVRLLSIDLYGDPSEAVVQQLEAKVRMLGGAVRVHRHIAGIARFGKWGQTPIEDRDLRMGSDSNWDSDPDASRSADDQKLSQ